MRKLHSMSRLAKTNVLTIMLSFCFVISGCGDDGERPETIDKLRALGVAQSPVNAAPGETVNLTFYLAGAPGLTIVPEVITDSSTRYGFPVAVTPITATPSETNSGALSIYEYRASMVVPATAQMSAAIAKLGFARTRYSVKFTAGQESESVVGDSVIYTSGSSQLAWTAPVITIDKPDATGTSGNLDLTGTIVSSGAETNRVSWFVSSGKIKNRRSKATQWQDVPAGTQTLIMTVRGAKSGAFAIKTKSVTIN